MKKGKKHAEMGWDPPGGVKYMYKRVRYYVVNMMSFASWNAPEIIFFFFFNISFKDLDAWTVIRKSPRCSAS